ncbi:MAG: hypothetical protein ACK4NY_03060 [Spirosomataceae bacterium]
MKKIILLLILPSFCSISFGQSITLDPQTTQVAGVQVASDLAFRRQKREVTNGGYANYNRDNSSYLIFEGGGTLSGIADGQDGMLVYVFNGYPVGATTTGELTLQHENVLSTAANRILTPSGADFLVGKGGVALIYDGSKQRWRVATPEHSGGSFSGWGLTGNSGTSSTTNFIGTTDARGFKVKTNNLDRIYVEGDGDVGIGTTVAKSKLHVMKGSAGNFWPNSASISTFENNTDGYLSILTPNTSAGGLLFGSPDKAEDGIIHYLHSSQKMQFGTKSIPRVTIDSVGFVGINTAMPKVELDILGAANIHRDLSLRNLTLQPTVSATYDPLDRANQSFVIIEPSTNIVTTIKGFSRPSTGRVSGTLLFVSNGSVGSIVLKHNDSSIQNDRILTNTGSDVTISGRGGAIFIYLDGWRLIAYAL